MNIPSTGGTKVGREAIVEHHGEESALVDVLDDADFGDVSAYVRDPKGGFGLTKDVADEITDARVFYD